VKITDIEMIPIAMPLAKRYDRHDGRIRMHDIDQHLVVRVRTDNGLVGYGDSEDFPDPLPPSVIETLIGLSPFEFLHNDLHIALGMALYDVMGKYLEVPAYKLMGQKVRDAVPMAAWTRPCAPEVFAEEIQRAAGQGYTVFKMHTDERYDVIDQTRAAEEVAPEGFKLHWDFNANRTLGAVQPILNELEKNHPIVGFIEDPLVRADLTGWCRLREKMRLPLVMHVPLLGGIQEVIQGAADICMIGSRGIGDTLQTGFAYAKANIQVLIQQSGNTLMKALTLHQAAVLPTATAHSIVLDDQYDEDITTTRIPVVEGFARVPEAPGLGVEVDEEKLAQAAARKPIARKRFIGILHLPQGHKLYMLGNGPGQPRIQPHGPRHRNIVGLTGHEEGTIRGTRYERWLGEGSAEFERMYERLAREGTILEDGQT
jgi:L-alanine-DL-glutamate epimerase-like enolase superfamily enzyme